jgi:uncharacterized protein YbjT (DUF2867 family)
MTQVLLAGGTGLVGSRVRDRLQARPDVELTALVRRGPGAIDFEQLTEAPATVLLPLAPNGCDVAISCLGTTLRTAGSEAAMFRVDHDYVLAVARGARALGAQQFILMTSVGAGGPGFYLRTKGAVEAAVEGLGFERVDLVHPGFLMGKRDELRPLEAVGQRVFAVINPLMIGGLARYGAIDADAVAAAIAALVGRPGTGRHVHENAELTALAETAALTG